MQTTRWLDKSDKKIDDIITSILSFDVDGNETLGDVNFSFEKIFIENQKITLNEKEIQFNKINFSYDSIVEGGQPIEDRTIPKKGFLIIYNTGNNINYIIDKNSGAKSFLRKINNYTERGIIEENMIKFNDDFFIWLISKVYQEDNILDGSNHKEIEIKSIKGFRGRTTDLLTQVKADGETVINIISTLAFLLESKNINQITIDIGYDNIHQNIGLKINKKGNVYTDADSYIGELINERDIELRFSKIILMLYLEILPKIYQSYNDDLKDEIWGKDKNKDFIELIKKDVLDRIQSIDI